MRLNLDVSFGVNRFFKFPYKLYLICRNKIIKRLERETKVCQKCKKRKSLDKFSKYKWGLEQWIKPEENIYLCKKCYENYELSEEYIILQLWRKVPYKNFVRGTPLFTELIEQKRNIIKMKRLIKDLKTKQNELSKS